MKAGRPKETAEAKSQGLKERPEQLSGSYFTSWGNAVHAGQTVRKWPGTRPSTVWELHKCLPLSSLGERGGLWAWVGPAADWGNASASVAQEVSGHLSKLGFSPALGSSGRRVGESRSHPRDSRERRHFLSTGTKEEESCWGPSLPLLSFVGVSHSGSSTNFLFLSRPPLCPLCVSPLIQAEKILPGLLERLWVHWEAPQRGPSSSLPFPQPLPRAHGFPRPRPPASSWGRARGKFSRDAGIGCPLQKLCFLPVLFFHITSRPWHPKHKPEFGPVGQKGTQQDKQVGPAPPPSLLSLLPSLHMELGDEAWERRSPAPGPSPGRFPAPRHPPLLWPTDHILGDCCHPWD